MVIAVVSQTSTSTQAGEPSTVISTSTIATCATVFTLPQMLADHVAVLHRQLAQAGDRELARDDHHRHPGRQALEGDERDERGRDQRSLARRGTELVVDE